jgi:hypothetical protein
MNTELLNKVEQSVKNLEDKSVRLYFLVQDTKGNARAGVRHIYDMALTLKNNGFNPIIIHEGKEYTGVSEWLGEKYMELPHESIEGDSLKISPEDFIFVPEIYGHVFEQVSNLPCGKVVICQAYDHMLETLQPGTTWSQYSFLKAITTTEKQTEYIKGIMKNVTFDIIEPYIPEVFSEKEKPSKPIVSIHTRDQRDTMKIIKTFYLKYPQFRWVTFRDMRGLSQEEFAKYLKDSFVSVWVDDTSGFGTFPIESMACKTPVIGKVPNMKPDWMLDSNGVWTYELNQLPDIIAEFIQNWLEDNISEELYRSSLETASKFKNKDEFESSVISTFENYLNIRKESFVSQLDKLKVEEEN